MRAFPAWQRLLERPRLLHRLATFGLLGAAIIAGINAFVRGAPDGASQDTRYLTYVFEVFVWIVVVLAALRGSIRRRPLGDAGATGWPTALPDRLHPRRDHHRDPDLRLFFDPRRIARADWA